MADARLIHKKGSHGERIKALSHLEFRVWTQFLLSADDFGVMRASISVLQADNPRLEMEPTRKLKAAMSVVARSGLVQTFTHQGVSFWWQPDWQDFQQIRYPRESVNPLPPVESLALASVRTLKLFEIRAGQTQEDCGKVSETSPHPARAGGRETLTLTLTPQRSREESARETTPLIDGRAHRRHGQHAWCDRTRNVCVPYGLHSEFMGRLCTEDAAPRLKAWYPTVLAKYAGRPIGDDLFDFWRHEFAAWVGTVTAKPAQAPPGRGQRVATAFDEAEAALVAQAATRRLS